MTDATLTLVTEPAGAGYPPGSAPEPDSGLVSLVMLARFHNIAADADQLAHDFREPGQRFGVPQILLAAKQLGARKVMHESVAALEASSALLTRGEERP